MFIMNDNMIGDLKDFPKTVSQAVKRLKRELPLEDKGIIKDMQGDGLSGLHISIGRYIRNEFGLWSGNNELMESCCSVSGADELHEDDASAVIITELWKQLQKMPDLKIVK